MPVSCCQSPAGTLPDGIYRRVLWIALFINTAMFAIELIAGRHARSVSLQADALDFFGDATTYAITLVVLGMGAQARTFAGMAKGISLGLFGVWVLITTFQHLGAPQPPVAGIMGGIGLLALAANLFCAFLLFKFRAGDANMRSVWLCSRNDAIANIAVIAAGAGVWASQSVWPDLLVGATIASLSLWASASIIRQSLNELKETHSHAH